MRLRVTRGTDTVEVADIPLVGQVCVGIHANAISICVGPCDVEDDEDGGDETCDSPTPEGWRADLN